MGYLGVGEPLGWTESLPYQAAIKRRGIRQFLQLLKQFKDYQGSLKWGDEIEVLIVRVDEQHREIRLALDAGTSIHELRKQESEELDAHVGASLPYESALWQPEYASYMIEALPGAALDLSPESWLRVEPSIRSRRAKLRSWLGPCASPLFMTSFPLLGVDVFPDRGRERGVPAPGSFASPTAPADPLHSCSRSIFVGDEVINPHPRFGTLTANIRRRRGCKVEILVPLYIGRGFNLDATGKLPNEPLFDGALGGRQCILYKDEAAETDGKESVLAALHKDDCLTKQGDLYIYMDAMCFGMGMNCVQATFSCRTISDARYLYDQLIVLAPLLLSLTAATPFLRGCVAATDTRWDVISMSVDTRRAEEMNTIKKSRYSGNSLYISDGPQLGKRLEELNDLQLTVNECAYDALIRSGVDPLLARHVAFLFVHDPLVIFKDRALRNGQTEADLVREGEQDWGVDDGIVYETAEDFENMQSTNWNAVRFKPPPQFMTPEQQSRGCPSVIGWRVELRTPEVQFTDFENAACITFIAAIVQLILEAKVELYIPMSHNDVNMQRAAKLNSILNKRFWFRRDVRPNANDISYTEMSLHSILFGEPGPADDCAPEDHKLPGLLKLCKQMFETKVNEGLCSAEAFRSFMEMYNFLYLRTAGELPTDAAFLRACLAAHPDYRGDSVIPPGAAYDICRLAMRIGNRELEVPELLGPFAGRNKSGVRNVGQHPTVASLHGNSSTKMEPEALLHGKGRVAASLQLPDIHTRLRVHMLDSHPGAEDCARAESVCNAFPHGRQQLILEQLNERPSAEVVGGD